jgi:hypothetical protein
MTAHFEESPAFEKTKRNAELARLAGERLMASALVIVAGRVENWEGWWA